MTMRSPLIASSLALAALHGPVFAQAAGAPAAPKLPQPTKEQVEDAAYETRVMVSAMQSDKVDLAAKNALFECIYNNSMAKISTALAKVAADNVGKYDKRNADHVLSAMLGVCGYKPKAPEAGTTPATPTKPAPATPAKPGTQPAKPAPQGR